MTQTNDSSPNTFSARVRQIVFAGATSTVRLDANGLLLEALVLQPNGLRVGQECQVVLDSEHLKLLKTEEMSDKL